MSSEIHIDQACYHCGDSIGPVPYGLAGRQFCCLGCQTVYQIMHENGMDSYYKYNAFPGKSQRSTPATDLTYLDEPKIVAQLLDYMDEQRSIITFYIPAIHCSSCIWLLEHLYRIHKGVSRGQVDFMKKQVSIVFDHAIISLRELVVLLISIGYEPKITLQDVVQENKKVDQRDLIARIAVAGFCFGNSMMLSFPDYFGMSSFEKTYSHYFGYLNLLLALPVFLYSASGYFTSAWHSLKQARLNLDVPLALGILVLFLRTAVEVLLHTGPGFADTLCSLVFFILIGRWVQQRTYHHLSFERDYRSYFPVAVTVLHHGDERAIPLGELKIGDRIWIRHNEIIPADAILLKGEGAVDFSFVTGESKIIHKGLGEMIYAGGRQMGEAMELEVMKPVSQSYLTRLWNNDQDEAQPKEYRTFVGFISKYFTVGLVLVALSAWVYWWSLGNTYYAWAALTAVLIIACPCALALSSPFTLSAALSIFDKNRFYLKNASAIEQMAAIDCLVFDKTGTISSPSSARMRWEGSLSDEEAIALASVCRHSSHPLSRQIVQYLNKKSYIGVDAFEEIAGQGITAQCGGLLLKIGSARYIGAKVNAEGTVVYVQIDGDVRGIFQVEQSWRPNLGAILQRLSPDYELHLLSGDNERHLSEMTLLFPDHASLLFNQHPGDKLQRISDWEQEGRCVAMIGDGLNDAGALRKAHVGIAVSDDINNFSPGCDAILDGANFNRLPDFFHFAKDAVWVIRLSFGISILYNVVGLSFAVQGTMSPLFAAILMPLSTVTIISFTSLTTRWLGKRRKLL
ncbi:heavy metal translocating P-type ATPase metal-binding domain-containing protein [Sphingobacterium sp. lm-10]|uniref:heavy metal translocating P-type ATPase n=1 Tax=Sphingobacterium sp. lm-10 TaxID=2944904 RepID=UPI0020209A72|nr:heavy metal translocating P-type ATPase metal-binding domain-containing protein [Sphingobacterium sp. lm-10]MCL7989343.1 heavy metal translocating P-type ATPase metal-binding domain-containing protein [Sphingobacterium sp. lm-10]